MKLLCIATSHKPNNFDEELQACKRYRLEYLDLCRQLGSSYWDYDPPWMHNNFILRKLEEKSHFDFYWSLKIARFVKEHDYDTVISMSERAAVPLGSVLDNRVKHFAVIINTCSPKWVNAIRLLGAHKKWHKIITYSHAETAALRSRLNLPEDKVVTVHNYVDTEFFNPSCVENGKETDKPFFISQGLANRDYPTLIKAMRKLPHIECHISAVSAWDQFNAGYEGMQIPKNVVVKPYNHPFLIRESLSKCRFLAIPLQPDTGMWCSGSTSILQAQGMGKPVIVTRLPGIAEYLVDGETGFLVDGKDPDQLAEKIDFLWKNHEKSEEMGRNGQEWVEQKFSLDKWIQKISELIQTN